jgi:hypothetical protein
VLVVLWTNCLESLSLHCEQFFVSCVDEFVWPSGWRHESIC